LTLAHADLSRSQMLVRTTATARAEYDTSLAAAHRIEQEVAALKANLDLLEAGFRQEEKDEAAAAFEKARVYHEMLLAGSRQEDKDEAQAKVDEATAKLREVEANLKEALITAPEPAVVEVLTIRKGSLVPANQPIIRVLRTSDLWVKVYVPETE